jgi:hypothetical protein
LAFQADMTPFEGSWFFPRQNLLRLCDA